MWVGALKCTVPPVQPPDQIFWEKSVDQVPFSNLFFSLGSGNDGRDTTVWSLKIVRVVSNQMRVLRYHARQQQIYYINFLLLNHYAWVHVLYTPAWGGNTNTPPKTEPPVLEQTTALYYLFHVRIRYNLIPAPVDHNRSVEYTQTVPLLGTGL